MVDGFGPKRMTNEDMPMHSRPGLVTKSGDELFFGLVGPAGTDLNTVVDALKASLKARNYTIYEIRLSELLSEIDLKLRSSWDKFEEKRMRTAMNAGNEICRELQSNDAVMRLGLMKFVNIRRHFHQIKGEEVKFVTKPIPKAAYIFKSLKRPEEAELLRQVCGCQFFLISVYEPRHNRITNLAQKISKSHRAAKNDEHVATAKELIQVDEKEQDEMYGQNVGELFYKGDFFVEQGANLYVNIDRFIRILFGAPFITPTRDEYGTFLAHSIALRSADLSRQVGAVIMNCEGDVISEGCNEVPLQGGGAVWHDLIAECGYDNRDFKLGHDASTISKYEIFSEIIEKLKEENWLSDKYKTKEIEDLKLYAFNEYLDGLEKNKRGILRESKLANILEYGRVVHAEMHALCSAARLGRSVKNAVLYTTTFPCHMCARHIIAAGISRVVYIEPYPKSATSELYGPMVKIDGDPCAFGDALEFDPFSGVAPSQYFKFFSKVKRKDKTGYAVPENYVDAAPKLESSQIDAEHLSRVIKELRVILERRGSTDDESESKRTQH